ncbi:4-hydroxythreonine-4-phosphate dehydrogenase [Bacteroidia bacterium]|nr:4-hydroxythreonine-4-phosphate dehydrogenase [Bacteroidia bacterium]
MIKVGITQGDINSVASEWILKTLEDVRVFEFCTPVVYGSSKVLNYYKKILELPAVSLHTINQAEDAGANRLNVVNVIGDEMVVEVGKPTAESAKSATMALTRALQDLKKGSIDVLLTAPAVSDSLQQIEVEIEQPKKGLKISVCDSFRMALATDKSSLSEIASVLTTELLTEKIKVLQHSLIHDFLLTSPRIAVLSLNPQAGIREKLGKEEETIIAPAVKAASDAGIICFGPYSADQFFGSGDYRQFDAVLAMYFDQGMVAFQSITSGEGAIFTANLPYVFTSAHQDVSFEEAGKNTSSPDSFRTALYLAVDIFRNKLIDKEINKNPLKKQFFERGSDNEKLDLTKEETD